MKRLEKKYAQLVADGFETVTIDGEPASKRRVGQFIRRARESMEKP